MHISQIHFPSPVAFAVVFAPPLAVALVVISLAPVLLSIVVDRREAVTANRFETEVDDPDLSKV